MTTRLLLIRHGETELSGRFCGHLDPALNESGRRQSKELEAALAEDMLDAVYCSDLQRASALGETLAASRALRCQSSAGLREIYFGEWEGLDWSSIERHDPELAARWLAAFPYLPAPGAEEFSAFENRVLAEVKSICSRPEARVAIVTHAGVIRVLLQNLVRFSTKQAWEQPVPLCSALRLNRDGESGRWRLVQ
jgi:broad specificity phosphatase PhoE